LQEVNRRMHRLRASSRLEILNGLWSALLLFYVLFGFNSILDMIALAEILMCHTLIAIHGINNIRYE
jgi:hypothetical protein